MYVLVATFGLEAVQKLFVKMLRSVFRAPMSFFDSTPAGRILNHVSFLLTDHTLLKYAHPFYITIYVVLIFKSFSFFHIIYCHMDHL